MRLVRLLRSLPKNALVKNSFFLMASAGVQAVLGFGFWLFIAHLYRPADIGTASALMAITAILVNVSMVGANSGLVRFLSGWKDQSRAINTAIIIVGALTMLVSGMYVGGSQLLGLHVPLLSTWWQALLFIVVMPTLGINMLTDAVFIANRRAEFHTAGYTALGLAKLLLPIALVAYGATGVFASYIGAVVVSLALSLILMKFTCGYRLFAAPDWSFVGKVRRYALHNYIGVILGGLPSQIMPVIILRSLSAADVAYFSIAWTMANLIYVIPAAVSQSMLAESAHDERQRNSHVASTVKVIALGLTPVVILATLAAPYLLGIFGAAYAAGSTQIFQILTLAAFSVAINEVCGSMWNIAHRTGGIILAQFWNVAVTVGSAYYTIRWGIAGAGVALALGSIAANFSHLWFGLRRVKAERR